MRGAIQVSLSHLAGDLLGFDPVIAAVIAQHLIGRAANVIDGERNGIAGK